MIYDVVVIGAGASGLFAALQIVDNSNLTIAVLEKAKRLNDARNIGLAWLGGASRSAAKLFLETEFGGSVASKEDIDLFKKMLLKYYPAKFKQNLHTIGKRSVKLLSEKNVELFEPETIQLSEDKMIKLGDALYSHFKKNANVVHKINVSAIFKKDGVFHIVTQNGEILAKNCIIAAGRNGLLWRNTLDQFDFKIKETQKQYDIGLRLEFPLTTFSNFAGKAENFVLRWDDFRTTVPIKNATIETEESGHIKIANGRSCAGGKKTSVNLSLMKTFPSKNAFNEIYRLSEMANILSDGQLVREPLSKVLKGESVLSPIPEFASMVPGLVKLCEVFEGLEDRCTVYAPEARTNTVNFDVDDDMQTKIPGLYIVGDMSGHTSSFVQAACSGIRAAKNILKKKS